MILFFFLVFPPMDDNDNPFSADKGWDFDLQSRNRAQRLRLLLDYNLHDDDDIAAADKVYLVPYRGGMRFGAEETMSLPWCRNRFGNEEFLKDLFSLQIGLFISWETNSLVVRISQKDNAVDCFKIAYIIFSSKPEPLHIWDFSGQITQFFINDRISLPNDIPGQPNQEAPYQILLKVSYAFKYSKGSCFGS